MKTSQIMKDALETTHKMTSHQIFTETRRKVGANYEVFWRTTAMRNPSFMPNKMDNTGWCHAQLQHTDSLSVSLQRKSLSAAEGQAMAAMTIRTLKTMTADDTLARFSKM